MLEIVIVVVPIFEIAKSCDDVEPVVMLPNDCEEGDSVNPGPAEYSKAPRSNTPSAPRVLPSMSVL
jgi:hypothetical protein